MSGVEERGEGKKGMKDWMEAGVKLRKEWREGGKKELGFERRKEM